MPLDAWPSARILRTMAVLVWGVALLAICCRAFLAPHRNTVYPIFAQAGTNWREGTDIYAKPEPRSGLDQFRYSPIVAALFVPFSLLPEHWGGVLWRLLNAAVYLGGFTYWCRALLPGDARLTASGQAWLWILLIPLSLGNLNNGQANPLVLGCLLLAVAGVAQQRWNLAAVSVAVAILVKLYPLAVGLLLIALFPRKFTGRLLLALGIGLAAPLLLQQTDYVQAEYVNWVRCLGADDRSHQPLSLSYRDIRVLFRLWDIPISDLTYSMIQAASAAGVAGLCLLAQRRGWSHVRQLTLLTHFACCWMVLCGPATESATYALLAPTLAWTIVSTWPGSPWTRLGGVGIFLLFVASPAACWFPGGRHYTPALQPLAALLLTLHLLWTFWPQLESRAERRESRAKITVFGSSS